MPAPDASKECGRRFQIAFLRQLGRPEYYQMR